MTPRATAARSAKGGSRVDGRCNRPQWAQPSYRRQACTQCGRSRSDAPAHLFPDVALLLPLGMRYVRIANNAHLAHRPTNSAH